MTDSVFVIMNTIKKKTTKKQNEIITGDVSKIYGCDFNDINSRIKHKFREYSPGVYTNDYILAEVSSTNKIYSVSLLTDATSDIGTYTLFGTYPGLSYSKARELLTKAGFVRDDTHYSIGGQDDECFFKGNYAVYITMMSGS